MPVLGSNNGVIPKTLRPGDVAAWRDAILSLANGAELRAQMIAAIRGWVDSHFTRQFVALLQRG